MTLSTPSRRRSSPFATLRLVMLILALIVVAVLALGGSSQALAHGTTKVHKAADSSRPHRQAAPGKVGYASYYARKFFGRKMADGTPMHPDSDNAASLTLPLGSKALVTNLRNGRTALVTIRDRGPFIRGRIIDLSPSTAKMLGMLHAGVAKVSVVPLDTLTPSEKRDVIIAAAEGGAFKFPLDDDGE